MSETVKIKQLTDLIKNLYDRVNDLEKRQVIRKVPDKLPKLTTTERDALDAVEGDFIYNDTTNEIQYYNGSAWTTPSGGGGGSGTVTSVAVSGTDGIDVDSGSPITTAGTIQLGVNATTLKSHLAIAASDVSDFDTEVSNNTSVAANTSARHSALTVTDSAEIDFTLTGQDLTASLKVGSIDETKLDVSTNASLDLADSATQPGDSITTLDATAHRTFYSDASGNVTELAHGTSGYVLTSNGATTAPSWQVSGGGGGIDIWTQYSAVTPTRASADDPTYVLTFSGVDVTSIFEPGVKIRWVQNSTTRYGIVTVASFSTNSTITIYGGTDYDVDDTSTFAISDLYYSRVHRPDSFPMNPDKWTFKVTDTTARIQSSPTNNVWYNLGSVSADIPIGLWDVSWSTIMRQTKSGTVTDMSSTLSTGSASESDGEFTDYKTLQGASATIQLIGQGRREKILDLSSKTTYYLNAKTSVNAGTIEHRGDLGDTVIKAVCAYL